MYIINTIPHEKCSVRIYALTVFGPEISLIRSAHSFDDSDMSATHVHFP